jgi:hypothetical protein
VDDATGLASEKGLPSGEDRVTNARRVLPLFADLPNVSGDVQLSEEDTGKLQQLEGSAGDPGGSGRSAEPSGQLVFSGAGRGVRAT